jgi:hypothetical protein
MNAHLRPSLLPQLESLEKSNAVTGTVDGVPMVCGGVLPYWPGRGQVWCVFNEESKESFVPVLRGIKKFLDSVDFRRIEICVPCDEPITETAARRAQLLGFEIECLRAKKYLPTGEDCVLMSRVK